MTKEEALKIRENYQDRGPGKFEGEADYVAYFHDQYLDGGADEEFGDVIEFGAWAGMMEVSDDDRMIFPELKGMKRFYFSEDSQGFVYEIDEDDYLFLKDDYDKWLEDNEDHVGL